MVNTQKLIYVNKIDDFGRNNMNNMEKYDIFSVELDRMTFRML